MAEHSIEQENAEVEGAAGAFVAAGETAAWTLGRAARQSAANDNRRPAAPLVQIGLVALAAAGAAALIFAVLS